MEDSVDQDIYAQIKEYPCAFNLCCANPLTLDKLRSVRRTIVSELDNEDDCESEVIRKNNFLTFILFRLSEKEEAEKLSNNVVNQTNWENIASLGNRLFIMWTTGNEMEADKCKERLKRIKDEANFETRLTEARAEQAYYYSRLGGPDNIMRAINVFTEVLAQAHHNYLWKYGLGLTYRRATHVNIYCSIPHRLNIETYKRMAVEYLFDVADHADSRLQAMAYSQLLELRRYSKRSRQDDKLFRHLGIQELCSRALHHGDKIPSVLIICSKVIHDDDQCIKLLLKSIGIKKNSTAYHFLGKAYQRQAESLVNRNKSSQRVVSEQQDDETSKEGDLRCQTAEVNQACSGSTILYSSVPHDVPHTSKIEDFTLSETAVYPNDKYQHGGRSGVSERHSGFSSWEHGHGHNFDGHDYNSQAELTTRSSQHPDQYNGRPDLGGNSNRQTRRRWINRDNRYTFPTPNNLDRSRICDDQNQRPDQSPPLVCESSRSSHNGNRINGRGKRHNYHQGNHESSRTRTFMSKRGWSPRDQIQMYVRAGKTPVALSKDDDLVKKAIGCFEEAIKLAQENTPAMLDLGTLLKQTGQITKALIQFNNATNSNGAIKHHMLTVINAYEQSGLCYLQLSQTDDHAKNYASAQRKLTEAICLAADLVTVMPELTGSHQQVWMALRTLETEISKENLPYPDRLKKKIKVLELAKEYRHMIDVVQKLTDIGDICDQGVVTAALNSYLTLKQPLDALAFQNLVAVNPDVKESDWWTAHPMLTLRIKVLLRAISRRLTEISDNPTILFQQLFQLVFGSCIGLSGSDTDQQSDAECGVLGDVLFVFDTNDSPNEEDNNQTVKSARYLKKAAAWLFGLDAGENLKGCLAYNDYVREIQLQTMKKYQVVIIVLGNEERDKEFDAVLKCVKKDPTDPPNHKILIIDAGIGDSQIPLSLNQFDCFKLEDIGGLDGISLRPDKGDDHDRLSYADIFTHVFRGNVFAVMKLFCFIIGQQWPPT